MNRKYMGKKKKKKKYSSFSIRSDLFDRKTRKGKKIIEMATNK